MGLPVHTEKKFNSHCSSARVVLHGLCAWVRTNTLRQPMMLLLLHYRQVYEWIRMLRCMPWWDDYYQERLGLGDRKTPDLDGFHYLLRGIELPKVRKADEGADGKDSCWYSGDQIRLSQGICVCASMLLESCDASGALSLHSGLTQFKTLHPLPYPSSIVLAGPEITRLCCRG